jgi:hypothetical protein
MELLVFGRTTPFCSMRRAMECKIVLQRESRGFQIRRKAKQKIRRKSKHAKKLTSKKKSSNPPQHPLLRSSVLNYQDLFRSEVTVGNSPLLGNPPRNAIVHQVSLNFFVGCVISISVTVLRSFDGTSGILPTRSNS